MATLASLTVALGIDNDNVTSGARQTIAAIRSIGSSVSGMTQDAEGNWRRLDGTVLSAAHANMTNAQRIADAFRGVGTTMRGVGQIARTQMANGLRSAGNAGVKVAGGLTKSFGVMSIGAVGAAGAMAAVPLAVIGMGAAVLKENETVKAAFSGLKDHVTSTMQTLAAPMVQPLADAAKQMQGIFDEIAPQIGELFKAAGPMIEPLVGGLGELVKGLMPGLVKVMQGAKPLVDGLADAFAGIGEGLGGFFEGLSEGIGQAGAVFGSLGGALGSILPVLGQLMGQMLQVAGPVLAKLLDGLGPVIAMLGEALGPVIDALGPILDQLVDAFLALLQAVMPIVPPLLQLVAALLPALSPLLGALIPLFGAVGEVVAALVPIIEFLIPIIAQLAAILANQLAGFIKSVVVPAIQMIAALLRGDFSKAWELAKQAASAAVAWLQDLFSNLPGRIANAIRPLVNGVWTLMKQAGNKALDAAKKMIVDVVNAVKSLPGKAKSALGNIGSALLNAGKQLIMGFVNGIKSMIGSVKNTLGDLTSKLTSWKGPESLDKRILTPNGQMVIGGFMRGIAKQTPYLRKQLNGLTSDLPGMAMGVTAKGVARASVRSEQGLTLDVTGADEDMKRLIRRIVKNDGRGSVQTAFGQR